MILSAEMILITLCIGIFAVMLIYFFTRPKRFKAVAFSAFTGLAALFVLNFFSAELNLFIPLNAFNLAGSFILGVPYLIAVVLLVNF